MNARWICMFITICTRLLFSSCKLCSSPGSTLSLSLLLSFFYCCWLMAAPLVHAPTDKKSWFIASTYTYYKVALAHIYAIFTKHSAELLLCISCDDSLYILSLYLRLSLTPVHVFHLVSVHLFHSLCKYIEYCSTDAYLLSNALPRNRLKFLNTHTHQKKEKEIQKKTRKIET